MYGMVKKRANAPTNGDAFTPGTPPQVTPIEGSPRQYQYRPGYNLLRKPEPDEGQTFESLRKFATQYDLLRRCLEIRKDELRTLEWTIAVKDRKNKKRMYELQEKNRDLIREITEFFRFPQDARMEKVDGKWKRVAYTSYSTWLAALLEDMFVIDAMTIYVHRKRNRELLALERIDGATIRPLIGVDGRVPLSGPAFQQYIFGVPRESFTVDELIYRPYYPSNTTPYGNSLVNQIVRHIQLATSSEEFLYRFFSDGSIPPTLFTVPKEWNIEQMLEFADVMNARLSGNPKALREFNVLPETSKAIELKPFDFKNDYMNYIAVMTCVLTGVQPTTAGIQPANSGLGGKSFSQQAQENHDLQMSYTAKWLQDLFTEIIQKYFETDEIEFVFTHLLEREEAERATINQTLLMSGQKSLDDIYIEEGRDPLGVSAFVMVGDRLLGLPDLITLSKKGSVAMNLGQVGGYTLPDGTKTKDITPPDNGKVVTPNPRTNADATAKLDTSNNDAPGENKHKTSQPPRVKDKVPAGPTINTTKGVEADFTKSSTVEDEKRKTHQLELLFIAEYLKLMRRVPWNSSMLNMDMLQAAFAMTPLKQKQLADAIYQLKRDVYIASHNEMVKQDGGQSIDDVPLNVQSQLRDQSSTSAQQIVDTYNSDLQKQMDNIVGLSLTDAHTQLNDWLHSRNDWKPQQIAVTSVSQPWNMAVFIYDQLLGRTSKRNYWVSPGFGVCENCQTMISNSPYPYDQAVALPIPNHPGCVHFITSYPN